MISAAPLTFDEFAEDGVEARVDRTNNLVHSLRGGELDLALVWGAPALPHGAVVKRLPMRWIGRKDFGLARGEAVPLALFEAPCVFRQPGIEALARANRAWRLTFTSPSLAGLWAAAAAGLGVTIRTPLGVPASLVALGRKHGLPPLPETRLSLYAASETLSPAAARLREILLEELAAATAAL